MTAGDSNSTPLSALEVAEAHFPEQAGKVQHLFLKDETFRSMCEDLAVAVETLTHVARLPDHLRETRRQEYASLVEALVHEIDEALSQSKVVIFRRSVGTKPQP
jgi:hypothetical protein